MTASVNLYGNIGTNWAVQSLNADWAAEREVATDDSGKLFYTVDDAIVVPFISQIATSPEAIAAFRRALVVALRREAFQHFRRSIALD